MMISIIHKCMNVALGQFWQIQAKLGQDYLLVRVR